MLSEHNFAVQMADEVSTLFVDIEAGLAREYVFCLRNRAYMQAAEVFAADHLSSTY